MISTASQSFPVAAVTSARSGQMVVECETRIFARGASKCVADEFDTLAVSRSTRDGKVSEDIGAYNPLKKGENFSLKLDRAQYWISKGAQPSDTVASFIKKAGKPPVAPAAA